MPEVEREDILAQRQEELQRIQDKRNLDQMFRDRTGGGEESVSKAAKSKWPLQADEYNRHGYF
jgi:RNA polymerase-associated protein RTF1